jgi:hypothetical protein
MNVFREASLTPTEVLAGDSVTFEVRLVVGPAYTQGPSRILLDCPATLGMSRPSLLHQETDGYAEVYCSNPRVRWSKGIWDIEISRFTSPDRRSYRGMACRVLAVDLSAGLADGDVLTVRWGEVSDGYGPGTKVTTVVPRPAYDAELHVRYFANAEAGLPDYGRSFEGFERPEPDWEVPLSFRVRPRPAEHLRLLRRHADALLLPLDRFRNVAEVADATELADADETPQPTGWGSFSFPSPAVHVTSRSLPLTDAPPMDDVHHGLNLYWGDIHTHSAFSNDCIEREKMQMTPADLMGFAGHRAGLDFFAVTDHHQPWDEPRNRIRPDHWERTVAAASEADEPGRFLALGGFEFRGPRGDTAVVFADPPDYDRINRPEWTDIRKLWEGLDGADVLSIPHFHNPGRLDDGEWWAGPQHVEPVLEIFSCHGSYERQDAFEQPRPQIKKFRPDRCGAWLLRQGQRYGLCANSDGHKGHVGTNGVTAVFAKELTREAIFAGYRARHVYATSNARLRLVFTGNGRLMGSAVPSESTNTLHIDVTGEAPLKKVELLRNAEPHELFAPDGRAFGTDVKVSGDEPAFYAVRVTQQDNHVAWSSPIWFE